jgi:hypothetical protein
MLCSFLLEKKAVSSVDKTSEIGRPTHQNKKKLGKMSTNGIKKSLAYLKLVKVFFLLFLLLENKPINCTAIIGEAAKPNARH